MLPRVFETLRKKAAVIWRIAKTDLIVAAVCGVGAVAILQARFADDSKSFDAIAFAAVGALLGAAGSAGYRALTTAEQYKQGAYTERAKAVQALLQLAREYRVEAYNFWETRTLWYFALTLPRHAIDGRHVDPEAPDDDCVYVNKPEEMSRVSDLLRGRPHIDVIFQSIAAREGKPRRERVFEWNLLATEALAHRRHQVLRPTWHNRVWIGRRGERAVYEYLDSVAAMRPEPYPEVPSGQLATAADIQALIHGVAPAVAALEVRVDRAFEALENSLLADLGYVPD
jgi:hypothetical protein